MVGKGEVNRTISDVCSDETSHESRPFREEGRNSAHAHQPGDQRDRDAGRRAATVIHIGMALPCGGSDAHLEKSEWLMP